MYNISRKPELLLKSSAEFSMLGGSLYIFFYYVEHSKILNKNNHLKTHRNRMMYNGT